MRKLPRIKPLAPGEPLTISALLGLVWHGENDGVYHTRWKLVKEKDGFIFRRLPNLYYGFNGWREHIDELIYRAQDRQTAVFEFSCQEELDAWAAESIEAFCALCGTAPCSCYTDMEVSP